MSIPLASADEHHDGTKSRALGMRVPQTGGAVLRRVGAWAMRVKGWRFEGAMPDVPKLVVIVAPHTSNWDFFIGVAAKWALGLDARWLGKHTLFIPPLGWILRAIGGVPVDRDTRRNLVEGSIAEFHARDRFVLVLAPEGTRRRVTAWRSGFWHVARGAGVPICCVALDWGRKVVRLGPTITPVEDDPDAGIARVQSSYDDVRGFDPSRQSPPVRM